MILLYLTNSIDGAGGLERVLGIKASYLADKLGYEVHILTLNESQPVPFYAFSSKVYFHSIEVEDNPVSYILSYVKGIKKAIKTIQPDVISVCDDGLKGFFTPLILGKKSAIIYERHVSKEIEMQEHFSWIKKKGVLLKWSLMALLAKKFKFFVVLTNGNLNEWTGLKNLKVIPNPLPFFPPKQANLQNKKVIAVGKQSYQKSYDRLLNSWALLDPEFQDWQLHIYGKIDKSLGLEKLAQSLKIENQVFFHPPEKKIEEKYAESSIFVLSSRYEGFGMVLIEAMSFGIPCVSFDCNYGPSDIITNNEDGFLIPNGNEKQFAAKLELLMKNQELRSKMGDKARENVQRFLPENVFKYWSKLFNDLIYYNK